MTDRRAQKDDVQADQTTLSGKAETAVIRSLGAYSPAWTIGAKTSSGKINLSRRPLRSFERSAIFPFEPITPVWPHISAHVDIRIANLIPGGAVTDDEQ